MCILKALLIGVVDVRALRHHGLEGRAFQFRVQCLYFKRKGGEWLLRLLALASRKFRHQKGGQPAEGAQERRRRAEDSLSRHQTRQTPLAQAPTSLWTRSGVRANKVRQIF
jgi:hypothetical protein